MMGRWVTVMVDRGSLELDVPTPGSLCIAGVVIGYQATDPVGPGKVPTALVTIRGRKGRTCKVNFSACYGRIYTSESEAVADSTRTQ